MTMTRFSMAAAAALVLLSGCGPMALTLPFGRPAATPSAPGAPVAYRLSARDQAEIPGRILGQVNLLRAQSGMAPLNLNPQLTAAAMAHSRDMSAQNRAWHFGSDGSSPLDRVGRQGYAGKLIGENVSETYETEIPTLSGWMQTRDTRDVLMDPAGRDIGLGWFQEPSNKIWWTVLIGG